MIHTNVEQLYKLILLAFLKKQQAVWKMILLMKFSRISELQIEDWE
ncbi:MAG: hypothetical protein KDK90_04370 [Leptospiraceae bacterium]|nr:hypothetical protein [Leptospiraceae bacterium]